MPPFALRLRRRLRSVCKAGACPAARGALEERIAAAAAPGAAVRFTLLVLFLLFPDVNRPRVRGQVLSLDIRAVRHRKDSSKWHMDAYNVVLCCVQVRALHPALWSRLLCLLRFYLQSAAARISECASE